MSRAARAAAAAAVLSCALAMAQQGTPHAGYVYPAGGQQGTSMEVVVGGQFLNGADGALVTGDGVRASVVEFIKPILPGQAGMLRDRLKELTAKWKAANTALPQDKTATKWTDDDAKEAREIRRKLAQFLKQPTNVSIAETVRLRISIAPGATEGPHELRLETPNGATNPLHFFVGRLPEWSKVRAGSVTEDDVNELGNLRKRVENPGPSPVVDVTAPLVINGQMGAGGVDRYRFTAHKGERLVAAACAREIFPYIADAVPGWFQASLTLYDNSGKEIAYADHNGFHPDPVLLYEIPADGEYTLAVHDSIYRGREDFVYRIALGEIPWVTGMFPLGGKAGAKTTVEFLGWNLSQPRMTEHSRRKEAGVEMLLQGEEEFNARPFALDTLPETLAKEQIHARVNAQRLSLPVIVNGRVAHAGEWEYFQFKGKAGEEIEAEVTARRLDSPLDSVLTLMDASGKTLAANDDFADAREGLLTDQADSLVRYSLPASGIYYLRLGDTLGNGGPEFAYRLRVSHPVPDFDLRVAPSCVNAKAGSIVPITVYAQRSGGFTGDILLKLKEAPFGVQLAGGVIPSGQTQVRMTLSVPGALGGGAIWTGHFSLEGSAVVGGKSLRRRSQAADDWTQAFVYHHVVASQDPLMTVAGRRRRQAEWTTRTDHPLALLAGRSVAVKFELPEPQAGQVTLALSDPPEGIAIEKSVPEGNGVVLYLKADGVKAKAGLRGNLIVTAATAPPAAIRRPRPNMQMEFLPALPFEVFASVPERLAASVASPK